MIACLLVAAAGCATQAGRSGDTPIPDAGSPGARIYAGRCAECHALPHPARLTYDGWLRVLPLMERRMAERGIRPLSDAERTAILVYLEGHSR